MSAKITAIIVDDEKGACENLAFMIGQITKDIDILGFANGTYKAEEMINSLEPQLVFLDINMPNETGIDFLKRLNQISFEVIFVTAYDQYAIKAFKLNAIDYILKPISKQYLAKALERVKDFISFNTSPVDFKTIDFETKDRLTLRSGKDTFFLKFNETSHIVAKNGYAEFNLTDKKLKYLSSYTLSHFEEFLPSEFIRVHKSYIVNSNLIDQIKQRGNTCYVILKNKAEIPVSRRKHTKLKQEFNF